MAVAAASKTVKVGTTFRYAYADSNPLWKVIKAKGKGVWICEIQNEPFEYNGQLIDSDWAGTQKLFATKEIQAIVGFDNFLDELHHKHETFYKNLKVGQRIHYQNGFDNWVRCVVVKDKDGENVLRPIALCGQWRNYDLPQRNAEGEIYLPYYPKMIADKGTFTPNASNLFEFGCKPRNGIDPNTLNTLDLSVPPMTAEQERVAALWVKVKNVQEAIKGDDPQAILDKVKEVLG
jgi:hypothetical protein